MAYSGNSYALICHLSLKCPFDFIFCSLYKNQLGSSLGGITHGVCDSRSEGPEFASCAGFFYVALTSGAYLVCS